MSFEGQFTKDNWHREATTLAVRNGIKTRRWGMRVTVYADPTPANNGEWVLEYNQVNTNRQSNLNWLKVANIGQVWGGGAATVTAADNGLHLDGTTVYLGGTFVEDTLIDVGPFRFEMTATEGPIRFEIDDTFDVDAIFVMFDNGFNMSFSDDGSGGTGSVNINDTFVAMQSEDSITSENAEVSISPDGAAMNVSDPNTQFTGSVQVNAGELTMHAEDNNSSIYTNIVMNGPSSQMDLTAANDSNSTGGTIQISAVGVQGTVYDGVGNNGLFSIGSNIASTNVIMADGSIVQMQFDGNFGQMTFQASSIPNAHFSSFQGGPGWSMVFDAGQTFLIAGDHATYDGDYSASFVARSIPDVGYTSSHIGLQSVDALVINPTASEDGFVIAWNEANQEYELVAGGGGATANNGLTETAGNIQLGGALTQNTTLPGAGFNLSFGTFASRINVSRTFATQLGLVGDDVTILADGSPGSINLSAPQNIIIQQTSDVNSELLQILKQQSSNSTIVGSITRFSATTPGGSANGFGMAWNSELSTTAGPVETVMRDEIALTDATTGTESVTWTKQLITNGSITDAITIETSSVAPNIFITLAGLLLLPNLPTSSAGLAAGSVWNNSGVLNIV